MCFLLCHTYCILGCGLWLIACICHQNVNRKYVSSRISDTVWNAFLIQEPLSNCAVCSTAYHIRLLIPYFNVDKARKRTWLDWLYFIVTGTILGKRAFCKQLRVLQGGVQVCFEVEGTNTNGSSESHEKIVQSKLLVEADGMPVVPSLSHCGWKQAPWIQENKPECYCL